MFNNVMLAEYHCRYEVREGKVKDIRDGHYHPCDDYASKQGSLMTLNPQRPF